MKISDKRLFWLLLIVCCLSLLPFLGLYDYNTKGEPRESIVSYSMIESGNWILPRNNGGDMAYKPPFFHWTVAAVSYIWGEVTEATSRIPSAVALIAMVMGCFTFYRKRTDATLATMTALIMLTSFELHRAGMNCRVDMVLTALTVGATLMLYRWWEQGMKSVPVTAILLMSLATLTKGPVGSIMPCLCVGVFLLLKKVNFFRAFLSLFGIGILTLIIPAIWYYFAWKQGGDEFLSLMMDENIGRMTGKMTTEVHVNPWWYNEEMLLVGFAPLTLIPIVGLFSRKLWKKNIWEKIKTTKLNDIDLFSLTCAIVVLVFYTIPKCKRSVYLMPMYPFVSYFLAKYMMWLADNRKKIISVMGWIMSVITLILVVATFILKLHVIPDTIFHGKHAMDNIATLHSLEDMGGVITWLSIIVAAAGSIWWIRMSMQEKEIGRKHMFGVLIVLVCTYIGVDGAWKVGPLNVKSQKPIAALIEKMCPKSEGGTYEYIEEGVKATGDPVHYFELNYYLHNTIGSFYKDHPQKGFLLIGDEDYELRHKDFEKQGYSFTILHKTERKVVAQKLYVVKFVKK